MRQAPSLHLKMKGVMKGDVVYEAHINNTFVEIYVLYKMSQKIVAVLGRNEDNRSKVFDMLKGDLRLKIGLFGEDSRLYEQLNFSDLDELELKNVKL